MTALKNLTATSAAGDLGLGDVLQTEVEGQIDERRKKMLLMTQGGGSRPPAYGMLGMGAAVSALGLTPNA